MLAVLAGHPASLDWVLRCVMLCSVYSLGVRGLRSSRCPSLSLWWLFQLYRGGLFGWGKEGNSETNGKIRHQKKQKQQDLERMSGEYVLVWSINQHSGESVSLRPSWRKEVIYELFLYFTSNCNSISIRWLNCLHLMFFKSLGFQMLHDHHLCEDKFGRLLHGRRLGVSSPFLL